MADAVASDIDSNLNGTFEVSETAVFIQERFGFAPDHAMLLAEHVHNEAHGPLDSSNTLAGLLGVQSLAGTITADDLEAVTQLSEQLLDPSQSVGLGNADPLDSHRQVLAEVPPGTELQDYTPEQIEAYNELHKAYMEAHGEHVLNHHHEWHRENGAGGRQGPGSGSAFLTMHRNMITDFEDFVNQGIPDGDWTVPELDPTRLLPPNLGQPSDIDPSFADRTSNDPGVTRPAFLIEGGNAQPPFVLDGKPHSGLEDFESLDDLGRALGERYHGRVHGNLGGTMGGVSSPMDPTFYSWHGEVDGVVKEWLQTENGQAWAAENPEEAALWGVTADDTGGTIWDPGTFEPPEEVIRGLANALTGLLMDENQNGTLERAEISAFLQDEYGMSVGQANKIANFLVNQSDDGIQSGNELADLMGVQTLNYTDAERIQDVIASFTGGECSQDSLAIARLKMRVALSEAFGQIGAIKIPDTLMQHPGISV